MGNKTLAIIKPDAIRARNQGKIIDRILQAGFEMRAMRMLTMSRPQAEAFYAIHRGKPFYEDLVEFMSSGPCIPIHLEKDHAVESFRALIGNTDSALAEPGTIRQLYGTDKGENAIHGSDSDENAEKEVAFFFSIDEF
jgi:nucleoside-diphosphate kinase